MPLRWLGTQPAKLILERLEAKKMQTTNAASQSEAKQVYRCTTRSRTAPNFPTTTEDTMTTESTTLYLNHDERLGDSLVIGTEEEFAPMLPEGADITDYDVFSFSTLTELLTHLMAIYPQVTTVEDACRKFLGITGSELVRL
jgi:hypothetical protein